MSLLGSCSRPLGAHGPLGTAVIGRGSETPDCSWALYLGSWSHTRTFTGALITLGSNCFAARTYCLRFRSHLLSCRLTLLGSHPALGSIAWLLGTLLFAPRSQTQSSQEDLQLLGVNWTALGTRVCPLGYRCQWISGVTHTFYIWSWTLEYESWDHEVSPELRNHSQRWGIINRGIQI